MKIVNRELLRDVADQAQASPRLRKNHNLHPSDKSCCHRLLNAIEPLSYIPPHRHLDPEKDEAFILLTGCLGIVTFTADGEVAESVVLSHESGNLAVDVPHGVYHTAVSLQPATVFFEAKAGPYLPIAEAERAAWAPPEGDPGAAAYLERLKSIFIK